MQRTITIAATFQTTATQFENGTPKVSTVANLLGTHYSDPDGAADTKPGIAVIQTGGNGAWQYSANATIWVTIGTVTPSNALLLPASYSVRFVPAKNASGSANLDFVAWDGSLGNAASMANTSPGGAASPFSANAGAFNLTVSPIVAWTGAAAALTPILPGMYSTGNVASPAGNSVASIFGAIFTESNPIVNVAVAVTALTGAGTWQYSTNGGTVWVAFAPAPSMSNAYLLTQNDLLRFVPRTTAAGTATLTAYAWDGSGSHGSTVNLTKLGVGGASGFSATSMTAQAAVNHAPTLSMAAFSGAPVATNAIGASITVSSLLSKAGYADPDGKNLPQGIAITGASAGQTLQYLLAGGTWQTLPITSPTAALFLPSTASLRLVAGAQTGTATLTFVGWDQSEGTAGQKYDTTASGGATAFSLTSSTLSIAIEAAAPSWSASSGAILTPLLPGSYHAANTMSPAGNTVASVFGSFFQDINPTVAVGIAVAGVTGNGAWQYSTNAGAAWTTFATILTKTNALLLAGNDLIRFVPNTSAAGIATLTAYAWTGSGGTPGTPANLAQLGAGGASPFSAATLTAHCAVNTAPTLANQNITLSPVNENATSAVVTAATLLAKASFADADGKAALSGIAVTADTGRGTWQWLNGTTWTPLPSIPANEGFLLPSTAQLRFKPTNNLVANSTGVTADLTFMAWDQTAGAADSLYSLAGQAPAGPFSAQSATAALSVNFVKQAPTWAPGVAAAFTPTVAFSATANPSPNPSGDTVAAVFGPAFFDMPGISVGIAITGFTGSSVGTWQYSTNGGSTWTNVPTVSITKALLLAANAKLRFLPSKAFSGAVTLTAYAWDGTGEFTGTANLTKTSLGGTSPFSSTTLSATCLVNSAPTLTA